MRSTVLSFVIASVLLLPVVCAAADINDIAGTWSGNWTPKGGILDAVTIEVRVEGGKVTGKFRTPVSNGLHQSDVQSRNRYRGDRSNGCEGSGSSTSWMAKSLAMTSRERWSWAELPETYC